MSLGLAILTLSLFAGYAFAETAREEHIACRDNDTIRRLARIANDGDFEAYKRLYVSSIAAGRCILIQSGQEVFRDQSSSYGTVCLRPRGQTDCYWTPHEVVTGFKR